MMGWYDGSELGVGGWIVMIAMMSIFWGLVIFAGVMIFRGTSSSRGGDTSGSGERLTDRDAMDILDERFALGELAQEEYAERKSALREARR